MSEHGVPLVKGQRSAGGQCSLDRRYFTDVDLFQAELQRIFRRSWTLVGHLSEFHRPSRHLLSVQAAGQPILLALQPDRSLRAFHNVCRHRGALLVDAADTHTVRSRIVCPYHGWTYGLDGEFKSAPNMCHTIEDSERTLGLRTIECRLWQGLILVQLEPSASPEPDPWDTLASRVLPWQMEQLVLVRRLTYDVRANWKLLFENYSECYHCPLVHPALARLTPYTSSENHFQQGPVLGGPMALASGVESMTTTSRRVGCCPNDLDPDQRRSVFYYTLFPTCFLSLHPDYVLIHQIHPQACDQTQVICDFLFHPQAVEAPGFDPQPAVDFWDLTNRQDWHVCERVQRGAASWAFQPGPLADLESIVAAFDRHYLHVMQDAAH